MLPALLLFTLFVVPSVYVLIAKDHRAEARESEAAAANLHAAIRSWRARQLALLRRVEICRCC